MAQWADNTTETIFTGHAVESAVKVTPHFLYVFLDSDWGKHLRVTPVQPIGAGRT